MTIEGINAARVKHARHDQILQTPQSTPIPRLVVTFERLEERLTSLVEIPLAHVHFPSQFLDEGQCAGMGDAASHGHGAVVRRAELFSVLEAGVELDLEGGDFHDMGAAGSCGCVDVHAGIPLQDVRGLSGAFQQISDDHLELGRLVHFVQQLAIFKVGLEPKALVRRYPRGGMEGIQRQIVNISGQRTGVTIVIIGGRGRRIAN
mmetsp:Transcript_21751/g.47320  ORF Transcript_21751/g.47320 Transcript_21751/m.47320 type:complete len:205 (-) Transcript_21751:567-1181(-)